MLSFTQTLFRSCLSSLLLLALVSANAWAYTPQALYDDVWKLVNAKFVDNTKNGQDWRIWRHRYDSQLKEESDAYPAIQSMLASLDDRYTRFLDPDDFSDEGQSIRASLFGIGIQIGTRDGKLLVIAPIEDTPADRAGLKPNDEIVEIDGKATQGISVRDAADLIRGEKGTPVSLLINRKDKKPFIVKVVRDEIKLKSVSYRNPFNVRVPRNIGYIKLSSFLSSKAAIEIEQGLKKYRKKQGLILDLRSNPGGLLSNAIKIANFFLDQGSIVSTVDRDGYKKVEFSRKATLSDQPLVILINEGSASASEILSGALQDHHRATLVGQKSFGKGLVQEINQLPGGSGVNITTQRYLTPSDRDINKKGIKPDVEVKFTEDDLKKRRDPQLKKAIEVLKESIDS